MEGTVKALAAFMALCPSLLYADPLPERLDWAGCVRLARENNPDLLGAQKSVISSRASYRVSRNQLLPQVGLSSGYSESDLSSRSSRWRAEGSAKVDVFNAGAYANVRSARARNHLAAAALQLALADVRSLLRQAYVQLLFSQQQIDVSKAIRDLRRDNAQLVDLKYQSGRESKGNRLKAQAELKEAEANFAQAERALKVAQRELNRQLGITDFKEVLAEGTLDAPLIHPVDNMAAVVESHPRVKGQNAAHEEAWANLSEARSALWPTLSASYSRSAIGDDYFPDTLHWSASGNLNFRLFAGGPTAAFNNITAARAGLERAGLELRSVRNAISADLESSWSSLLNSVEDVNVRREFLEAARQRNAESSVRYSSGLMSFEDWERVVTELVNAERGYIQAQRVAALAEARWDQARGLPLENP